MNDLIYNTTRGEILTIKEHRGWKYVNYKGSKIGVSTLQAETETNDPVFNYIFNNGFKYDPCYAMDYWIYRHRLKNIITTKDYKLKFNIKQPPKPLKLSGFFLRTYAQHTFML